MAREDYLFSGPSVLDVDQFQRKKMAESIAAMDGERLLNTSVNDLAEYWAAQFRIVVPQLDTDNIVVDQREHRIDVSQDRMRHIWDRSQPFYIAGNAIDVEIPFTGEAEAFKIRPNPHSLGGTRARVTGQNVTLTITGITLNSDEVRNTINHTVAEIERGLATLRDNLAPMNTQLLTEARTAIEARRERLLAGKNVAASLGFKMKERPGTAKTYTAPNVRRKIAPVMPAASSAPYKPEPILKTDDYEHILGVMQNMTLVMERSPSAFHSLDEEALRSHFLAQLNGHYEGQATGETFNYEGKTDILIRSQGKNIFIAECKFWGGPKKLTETIDQLLGYSSWRDTKTAIVIFNRNREFSKVLAAIPETVRAHPQYKRDMPGSTETVFRFQFAHRDDRNRELLLTVMAFDIPTPR